LSREPCEQCDVLHADPLKKRNVKLLNKLIVSKPTEKEIIDAYHTELGHVGVDKMQSVMEKDGHNWTRMNSDIRDYVAACLPCAQRKQGRPYHTKDVHITAELPFEKIMIDITGPLTPCSRYGYRYILGIVDVFSRYSMLIPLRSTDTRSIIEKLKKRWIPIFGYPQKIVSDNAPNLHSREMIQFCNCYQISKSTCSPYYPQGNGIIERLFRTSKDMIYATATSKKIDWVDAIPYVEMGLRSTKSRTTGCSPHEMIFKRHAGLPWRNVNSDQAPEISKKVVTERAKFDVGDNVMMRSVMQAGWLKPKFIGPCQITEILHSKVYRLNFKGKQFIRNEYHLKSCKGLDTSVEVGECANTSVWSQSGCRRTMVSNPEENLQPETSLADVTSQRRRTTRHRESVQRYGFS
jgi:transposase InsO family protein